MTFEIKVPVLPESVSDATIATWHKKPGEFVKRDENLVDIETDKVVLEVVAPADGSIEQILQEQGAVVTANQVIATFASKDAVEQEPTHTKQAVENTPPPHIATDEVLSPSKRRAMGEQENPIPTAAKSKPTPVEPPKPVEAPSAMPIESAVSNTENERIEKRVPMTRLRAKIAERLLAAQHNAAILTTFNEINMAPVIALRNTYKEEFMQKYGVRLGFMSFFVNAVIAALRRFPIINASVDGNDIVYHGFYDIGIAVSTERGLVVPILRDADNMSVADMEQKIAQYGKSAREGKIGMDDITGGTFTITNGGVFGSLMATPILNPPQSAILGMHKIEERPVVENKQVVIRPMMYVALSYDHRIIDGAESVQFLVTVKEMLEDPARLILSI